MGRDRAGTILFLKGSLPAARKLQTREFVSIHVILPIIARSVTPQYTPVDNPKV
jgi:hypothetical protein